MECEGISTPISASPIEVCMALCTCNGHSPEDSFILFDLLLFSIRYPARVVSRATTLRYISKTVLIFGHVHFLLTFDHDIQTETFQTLANSHIKKFPPIFFYYSKSSVRVYRYQTNF